MKNILLILLMFAFTSSAIAQSLNQGKSKVTFKIGSFMWSKVNGEISNMKGEVKFDENNLSASNFNVTIDASTIVTGNNKRDEHLRGEDFFNTEKYPTISFKSKSITKTSTGYQTVGTLQMKDVSKEVVIPFTMEKNGDSKTLQGAFEINRLDYNVGADASSMLVDKQVSLEITCVLD